MMQSFEVKVNGGTLIAEASTDPNNPGIYISYKKYEDGYNNIKNVCLVENTDLELQKTKSETAIRVIVWGNPQMEDYTESTTIDFIGGRYKAAREYHLFLKNEDKIKNEIVKFIRKNYKTDKTMYLYWDRKMNTVFEMKSKSSAPNYIVLESIKPNEYDVLLSSDEIVKQYKRERLNECVEKLKEAFCLLIEDEAQLVAEEAEEQGKILDEVFVNYMKESANICGKHLDEIWVD